MVFSSIIFIFFFLPVTIVLYLISGKKIRNLFLLLASILFYAWGEAYYVIIMLISTLLNYVLGVLLGGRLEKGKDGKPLLIISICLNLGILIFYKYSNFLVDNLHYILTVLGVNFNMNLQPIHLPIGISFYTFHSLSYIIDIYKKKAKAQKNIFNLALYISFFPQLVAGPIIKYHDIVDQLENRKMSFEKFSYGIERFIFGLGKKLIIADTTGGIADKIFALKSMDLTSGLAWMGIVCYTIQIYFDFSAYSDMAIGLAKIFGFDFLENFNYPYISKSIQEFWRRWHISLSTWFRDYLYIPLGGSRNGEIRTYRNILTVFILCGFWHGANWNFIIWGLYYGLFLVFERTNCGRFIKSLWTPIQHLYTLLVVMIGWVFFRAENLNYAVDYIKAMFGFSNGSGQVYYAQMFISKELIIVLFIAILGSIPIVPKYRLLLDNMKKYRYIFKTFNVLFSFAIFYISLLYLSPTLQNSSQVPFIYFKF